MSQKTSNFFYSLSEKIDASENKDIFNKIIVDNYQKTVVNLKKDPNEKIFLFFAIGTNVYFCINKYNNIEIYNLNDIGKYFNLLESDEINYITEINTISTSTKSDILKYVAKILGINIVLIIDKNFESLNKINEENNNFLIIKKLICEDFKECDLSDYYGYYKIFIKENSFDNFQLIPEEKKYKLNYTDEQAILRMLQKILESIIKKN